MWLWLLIEKTNHEPFSCCLNCLSTLLNLRITHFPSWFVLHQSCCGFSWCFSWLETQHQKRRTLFGGTECVLLSRMPGLPFQRLHPRRWIDKLGLSLFGHSSHHLVNNCVGHCGVYLSNWWLWERVKRSSWNHPHAQTCHCGFPQTDMSTRGFCWLENG